MSAGHNFPGAPPKEGLFGKRKKQNPSSGARRAPPAGRLRIKKYLSSQGGACIAPSPPGS